MTYELKKVEIVSTPKPTDDPDGNYIEIEINGVVYKLATAV